MSKKKNAAAEESPIDAEFVTAEVVEPEEETIPDVPPSDDPVIFGGEGRSGGSVELTILPPGVSPESVELAPAEPEFVDHLAPLRAEAEVLYVTYHEALQGLPYPKFQYASPAQQSAWMAAAERSLAAKEA